MVDKQLTEITGDLKKIWSSIDTFDPLINSLANIIEGKTLFDERDKQLKKIYLQLSEIKIMLERKECQHQNEERYLQCKESLECKLRIVTDLLKKYNEIIFYKYDFSTLKKFKELHAAGEKYTLVIPNSNALLDVVEFLGLPLLSAEETILLLKNNNKIKESTYLSKIKNIYGKSISGGIELLIILDMDYDTIDMDTFSKFFLQEISSYYGVPHEMDQFYIIKITRGSVQVSIQLTKAVLACIALIALYYTYHAVAFNDAKLVIALACIGGLAGSISTSPLGIIAGFTAGGVIGLLGTGKINPARISYTRGGPGQGYTVNVFF